MGVKVCRYGGKTIKASMVVVFFSGCMVVEEAARDAMNAAISDAVEREMSAMLAGYTDVMLYQLAYTQAFHLGGFGVGLEDFAEGEGATWHVEFEDGEESTFYTAERALLTREEDGSSWWYLRYTPEEGHTFEYEILVDQDLIAREMYLRDPETDEVRHHEFAFDDTERQEIEEGEEGLEEAGYRTDYWYLEEWGEYRQGRETVRVGAGTYNAELLMFTPTAEEEDYEAEYRWWVSEDVPGHLLRFEFEDLTEGGRLHGEMTDLRQDYSPQLSTL